MADLTKSQKEMAEKHVANFDKFEAQRELKRTKNYSGEYWKEVRKLCKMVHNLK